MEARMEDTDGQSCKHLFPIKHAMFWTNAVGVTTRSWRVKADFPRNHVKENPGGLSENQIRKAVRKGRGECLQGERDTCEEVREKACLPHNP